MGWNGFRSNPIFFLISQKLSHIAVVIIAAIVVFSSFAYGGRAASVDDASNQTILSSLINSEFGTEEENRLIEEYFDQEAVISPAQESYLNNLAAVQGEPLINPDEAGQDEEEKMESTGDDFAMKNPWLAETKKTKRDRTEIIYYAVESGDTVSSIADKFDVTINTVLWENNLGAYSVLHPGDKLAILPASGINHEVRRGESLEKIAGAFGVDKEIITGFNKISAEAGLKLGQKLFIPGGRKLALLARRPENYSGIRILKDLARPARERGQAKGVFRPGEEAPDDVKPAKGGKMNWPTVGYRITQYYTWRHHAVDIANHVGTALYAADAGIVEEAGWGRGYGNQIVINHGGGRKTRYAHLSKFYVSKGARVGKGQTIGAMGNTGWSTGPHLHFEVIINGAKYNPLNYIR